eukprot:3362138-Pyramimonas_sp.AAC.1
MIVGNSRCSRSGFRSAILLQVCENATSFQAPLRLSPLPPASLAVRHGGELGGDVWFRGGFSC